MSKANLLSGLEGDERVLISHILDLAERCGRAGAVMYSPFLNPKEFKLAESRCRGDFTIKAFGGYDDAERRLMALCPNGADEPDYPLCAVRLVAKDGTVYSHRDYLGAVLSLGIKREKVGDIITKEDCAIVFCHSDVAEFICLNLNKVASGSVVCTLCRAEEIVVERRFNVKSASVASLRLDCVLSAAIGKSREVSCELIGKGLVQLNYDIAKSASVRVQSGDVISARGYGKLIVETDNDTTRKGRVKITIKHFV